MNFVLLFQTTSSIPTNSNGYHYILYIIIQNKQIKRIIEAVVYIELHP